MEHRNQCRISIPWENLVRCWAGAEVTTVGDSTTELEAAEVVRAHLWRQRLKVEQDTIEEMPPVFLTSHSPREKGGRYLINGLFSARKADEEERTTRDCDTVLE